MIKPVPVSNLIPFKGVKVLAYSGPGGGKTPVTATAPYPIMGVIEKGLLSLQGQQFPAVPLDNYAQIREFYQWTLGSTEMKNYQTVCVDSFSVMADKVLKEGERVNAHGKAAYGFLLDQMTEMLNGWYDAPHFHLYGTCQQEEWDGKFRPRFPGLALSSVVPYLFDEWFHVEKTLGENNQYQFWFRTQEQPGVPCRDRSGKLAPVEPAHLGYIFDKCSGRIK